MIKEIKAFSQNIDFHSWDTFCFLDKATQSIIEIYNTPTPVQQTPYYPIVECIMPQFLAPFQKCVNLERVQSCITELEDDLTKYGFKLINIYSQSKEWKKII